MYKNPPEIQFVGIRVYVSSLHYGAGVSAGIIESSVASSAVFGMPFMIHSFQILTISGLSTDLGGITPMSSSPAAQFSFDFSVIISIQVCDRLQFN